MTQSKYRFPTVRRRFRDKKRETEGNGKQQLEAKGQCYSITENLSLKSMQVPDYDPNDSSHVLLNSHLQLKSPACHTTQMQTNRNTKGLSVKKTEVLNRFA